MSRIEQKRDAYSLTISTAPYCPAIGRTLRGTVWQAEARTGDRWRRIGSSLIRSGEREDAGAETDSDESSSGWIQAQLGRFDDRIIDDERLVALSTVPAPSRVLDVCEDSGTPCLTGSFLEFIFREVESPKLGADLPLWLLTMAACGPLSLDLRASTIRAWFEEQVNAVFSEDLRMRRIFWHRYGYASESETLAVLGDREEVSRERIRQLEKRALKIWMEEGCAAALLGAMVRGALRFRACHEEGAPISASDVFEGVEEGLSQLSAQVCGWFGLSERDLVSCLWWPISPDIDRYATTRGSAVRWLEIYDHVVDVLKERECPVDLTDLSLPTAEIEKLDQVLPEIALDTAGKLCLKTWLRREKNVTSQSRIIRYVLMQLGGEADASDIVKGICRIPEYRSRFVESDDDLRGRVISKLASMRDTVYRGRARYAFASQAPRKLFLHEFIQGQLEANHGSMKLGELEKRALAEGYNPDSVKMEASGINSRFHVSDGRVYKTSSGTPDRNDDDAPVSKQEEGDPERAAKILDDLGF